MSKFYFLTHPSPEGAYAGWSFCAIPDCECSLPKVCAREDDHCDRRKVCIRSECECNRIKVCDSPFCECNRPKVVTESYGNPVTPLHSGLVESFALKQDV